MTEDEWNAATDPGPMLEFIRGKVSDRKLRLFAVACCRRILHLMPDPRSLRATEVAERHADGLATDEDLRATFGTQLGVPHDRTGSVLLTGAVAAASGASNSAARAIRMQQKPSRRDQAWRAERAAQAALIRDLYTYQSASFTPAWLTSTVTSLANGIYADRAFERLPILHDALIEAGCDNADILNHCKDPQAVHCRGCWVIDLLTGRT